MYVRMCNMYAVGIKFHFCRAIVNIDHNMYITANVKFFFDSVIKKCFIMILNV